MNFIKFFFFFLYFFFFFYFLLNLNAKAIWAVCRRRYSVAVVSDALGRRLSSVDERARTHRQLTTEECARKLFNDMFRL